MKLKIEEIEEKVLRRERYLKVDIDHNDDACVDFEDGGGDNGVDDNGDGGDDTDVVDDGYVGDDVDYGGEEDDDDWVSGDERGGIPKSWKQRQRHH